MTHDTRFAPNPLFGVLTLATCKPFMRLKRKTGEWIAGWSSGSLQGCCTAVGEEKLLYLARITNKLTFAEYWNQYPQKRPQDTPDNNIKEKFGDNIYRPDIAASDGFSIIANQHHDGNDKERDLKGRYVLICEEFYYFGKRHPLDFPEQVRPNIPKGQIAYGRRTTDPRSFITFVKSNKERCLYKNEYRP